MTRWVELYGCRMAYEESGAGPPVLLLHGCPDTRHVWELVLDCLGEEVRAIRPDFPGFGDSSPLPGDFDLTPRGMVGLWREFVDSVDLNERFVVVVHDFGGLWLLPWVAEHPNRVRGLLVLNSVFQRSFRWHVFARIWQTPGIGELSMLLLFRWVHRWVVCRSSPRVPRGRIDAAFDRIDRKMKRSLLRVYRAWAKPAEALDGWDERLEHALGGVPTRVIWGDRDPYIPVETAERFGGQVEHLPDHGHWHPLSNPASIADALRGLAEGPPGRDTDDSP